MMLAVTYLNVLSINAYIKRSYIFTANDEEATEYDHVAKSGLRYLS